MAWSVINKDVPGKVPVFRTFICDTVDDINTLPNDVAPGSEAFCAENGNAYVLGVNKVWGEKKSEGGGSGDSGPIPVFALESYNGVDDCAIPTEGRNYIVNPDNLGKPFRLSYTLNNLKKYALCEVIEYRALTPGDSRVLLNIITTRGTVNGFARDINNVLVLNSGFADTTPMSLEELPERYMVAPINQYSAGTGYILEWDDNGSPMGAYWKNFAAVANRAGYDNKALNLFFTEDAQSEQYEAIIQLITGAKQMADANGTGAVYASNPDMTEVIGVLIEFANSMFLSEKRYPGFVLGASRDYIIPLSSVIGTSGTTTLSGNFDSFDETTGAFYSFTLSVVGSTIAVKCVKTLATNISE